MKKKSLFLLIILSLFFATTSAAKPVHLTGEIWVDMDPIISSGGQLQSVRVTCKYANTIDMWADNYIAYCADPLREGCDNNIPFSAEKAGGNIYKGNVYIFEIPGEVITGGQSAFNFAHDTNWFDADWMWLPDCKRIHLGPHVIYYKSNPDPNIAKSGGMHLLYVGPGAPFIPTADDSRNYQCYNSVSAPPQAIQAPAQISPAPAPVIQQATPAPAPAVTTSVAVAKTPVVKRPAREKCNPCEEAIKANTDATRKSVGDIDPAEPYEEQTLQSKARITKEAVGKGKPDNEGKSLSAHEKLGEPSKKEETVFGLLKKIDAQTTPPPSSNDSWNMRMLKELWWLWLIIFLCGVYCVHRYNQSRSSTP
ncbi:MAG: hypothetical protein WC678_04390 [Parcubacteria group bacterium]|jgi:hypothetical protein